MTFAAALDDLDILAARQYKRDNHGRFATGEYRMPPRVSESYARKYLKRGYTVQDHSGLKVRFDARFIGHLERNHHDEPEGNRERLRHIGLAKKALKSPHSFDDIAPKSGDRCRNYLAGFTNANGKREAYIVRVIMTPKDGKQPFLHTFQRLRLKQEKRIRAKHGFGADS